MIDSHARPSGVCLTLLVVLAGAGHAVASSPIVFPPYVQAGTPTGMTVMWTSAESGPADLTVTDERGHVVRHVSGPAAAQHVFRLRDLTPGTSYHYVATEGVTTVGHGRFHTNNPPEQTALRFAVFGDSGSGNANQRAIAARLLAWKPDFALHTGDVIYEEGENGRFGPAFMQPYGALIDHTVVYPSLGNHDYGNPGARNYLTHFEVPRERFEETERWYTFAYGHAQFFGLDTNQPFDVGSPQYGWLAAELARSKARWKFAFFHHPPYSGGEHGSSLFVRRAWGPLFERHDVQVVFTGHDHHYERSKPREDFVRDGVPTTYVVTGGAGAWLRGVTPQPFTAVAHSLYHFLGITLAGDRLEADVIDRDGRVIDHWMRTAGKP